MYCWIWVILFSVFCFFGGERGEEEGGRVLTETASQPSLWAGLSLPYATLLQRFFHFLSAKYSLFSIPRRFVCLLGDLVVAKEQDRAGQGRTGHRAWQGKEACLFFSFFFLSLLPYFLVFFFPRGFLSRGRRRGFSFLFG